MADYVIPLVWPDYKITVGEQKFSGLGHAGVLVVDGGTGLTRYFDYGRFARDASGNAVGEVRTFSVPNIAIGENGVIDSSSFDAVIKNISSKVGQNQSATGTVLSLADGSFERAVLFANSAMANEQSVLGSYSLNDNHCYTFAKKSCRSRWQLRRLV